jgi:tetratricopeptide (TPR) repeat protein
MTRTLLFTGTLWLLMGAPLAVLAAAGANDTLATLDRLYAGRGQADIDARLKVAFDQALQVDSGNYEVLWRAARYWQWVGDTSPGEAVKKQAGKKAWDLGLAAVQKDPNRIEGHFYVALGIGVYSQGVGILAALTEGLESKFVEHVDKAIALDPTFSNGGPNLAKGRFHFLLPWPKRDLEKAEKHLQQSLKTNPEGLRAQLYLAEVLHKKGDKAGAKHSLELTLAAPPDYDPAEARFIKARAVELSRSW